MSVYIETSIGDVVVDLYTDECPLASKNFLKLCKLKYFHNNLFFKVSRNFIAQTGDPKNDGSGGSSVYGLLEGAEKRCFRDEVLPELKHTRAGMLGMATGGADANASQFYITLAPHLDSLDGKHTLFGEIAEDEGGAVARLNAAIVDDGERPLQNIRIRRTEVLDDPFSDPPGLAALVPEASPAAVYEHGDRLEEDWAPVDDTREAEIEADLEAQKAANRKILLEMIGDRPTADAAAPEEYIFVCKLNAVTTEEDLETIFSRFGEIVACDVIRDRKTGDSLNYAFIGFTEKKAAEEAYLKMNNALIDDRRIKVDFSQSMHHQWKQYRRFGKQAERADAPPGGHGGGQLLAGGKFRLKSSAHGHGVGAALGLIGDASGHGAKHSRREEREVAREARGGGDGGGGAEAPRSGDQGEERWRHERDDKGARRDNGGQASPRERRDRDSASAHERDRHHDRDRVRDGGRREVERRERERDADRGERRHREERRRDGPTGRAGDGHERGRDRDDRSRDRDRDGDRRHRRHHDEPDRHSGRKAERQEGHRGRDR